VSFKRYEKSLDRGSSQTYLIFFIRLGTYKSLHIVDTRSSEILVTDPVSGPVHITRCHDSLIFISSCRQLRIHDCSNIVFVIHVTSGPVIEFCKYVP
jgi:hypothetical protein